MLSGAEGSGLGDGWVSLTSLISSCRCSSSEFCSLMKLNSAKLRSSTRGERGKAGSRDIETRGRTEKEVLRKTTRRQRQTDGAI